MTLSNRFSLLFILAILTIGCKDSNNTSPENEGQSTIRVDKSNYPLISNEDYSVEEIKGLNQSAKSILDHRIEQNETSWAHIEHKIWAYEFVYQNGEMSKAGDYDGYWIDMEPGHIYTYGYKSEQLGSGRYHYSPHTELLLLVDDKQDIKPRQYKAKITGKMLVLAGNPEYRDNGFQSKLNRVESRPE